MRLARWLRRLAAAAVLFVVVAVAYEAVVSAGFRFRWESEPAAATTAQEPAFRSRPSPPTRGESRRPADAARTASTEESEREPALEDPPPAGASEGALVARTEPRPVPRPGGARPIDFETFPDGSAVCAPCPVSDEYADWGVRFSFRSWSASSPLPFLVDAAEYLPEGDRSPFRVGPALADAGNMEVGVIRLDLPGRPSFVTFEVVGPSLIERFEVTAWSGGRRIDSAEIPRLSARTFSAAGGGSFRSETVAVESPAGIERVELDGWGPPGHLLLIDHLVIGGGGGGGGAGGP